MTLERKNIFGWTLKELQQLALDVGEKKFRGQQIYEGLYRQKVKDISQIKGLSNDFKERLKKDFYIHTGRILQQQSDDGTSKFLIEFEDGQTVESVLMDYHHGMSLCISTQVGCRMGCEFCASTKKGLVRNLTPGEMLSQVALAEEASGERISNVVMMGIGEPLDNYDNVLQFIDLLNNAWGIGQRHITLSTSGLVPQIYDLAEENLQINLAVSLHHPIDSQRQNLMPIAKTYSVDDLVEACRYYFEKTGRRITFEYALMEGANDSLREVRALAAIHRRIPVHINLIPLNPIEESVYKSSPNVKKFALELKRHGLNCTIRRIIGKNIDAACGQLRHKVLTR